MGDAALGIDTLSDRLDRKKGAIAQLGHRADVVQLALDLGYEAIDQGDGVIASFLYKAIVDLADAGDELVCLFDQPVGCFGRKYLLDTF